MQASLLPPNATGFEKALEVSGAQYNHLPIDIKKLWNPDECPEAFLPWLAWSLSVDFWDEKWPPQIKRGVIKKSIEVHEIKGTPKSIKIMLEAAEYGEVNIVEGRYRAKADGTYKADGVKTAGNINAWAQSVFIFTQAISNRMATNFLQLFNSTAPAHSELHEIRFHRTLKADGEIKANGEYKAGAFINA